MRGVFCADFCGSCGLTLQMEDGRLRARKTSAGFILTDVRELPLVHALTGVFTGIDDIPF